MPLKSKLQACLILYVLLNSLCLFAYEEQKIVTPESKMKVGLKGSFAQEFIVFSTGHVGKIPALGFAGFYEYPLLSFLSLGVQFNTHLDIFRELMYFDTNLFLKAPFKLDLIRPIPNFYLAIPIGFSLGLFLSDKLKLNSIPKGVNLGGLLGKEFFFAEMFGLSVEAGYVYRYLGGKTDKEKRFSMHFHELVANIGFSFGF